MKINFQKSIEVVGVLSIVGSLLFVGLQMLFDRQVTLSETYQNRADSRKADFRSQMESDDYMTYRAELWSSGNRPAWWTDDLESEFEQKGISGRSIIANVINASILIIHLDNLHYQYEQGFIDESYWQGILNVIETQMQDPLIRGVWLHWTPHTPVIDIAEHFTKNSI